MWSTVRYRIVNYYNGLDIVMKGLSEWYSPVVPGSGLHPRPAPASVLSNYFPEIDDSWSSIWYPSRAGEDVEQCHDRQTHFARQPRSDHHCALTGAHGRQSIPVKGGMLLSNRDVSEQGGCRGRRALGTETACGRESPERGRFQGLGFRGHTNCGWKGYRGSWAARNSRRSQRTYRASITRGCIADVNAHKTGRH